VDPRQHTRVDGTLGGGGHAAILREAGAKVLGIDRDHDAIAAARSRLGTDDVEYLEASFAAPAALAAIAAFHPDRILLDLGVSSHQIDAAERGFTFRQGAPLDMRMQRGDGRGEGPYRPRCLEQLARRTARDRLHRFTPMSGAAAPSPGKSCAGGCRRRSRSGDDFVNAIRAVLGPRSGAARFCATVPGAAHCGQRRARIADCGGFHSCAMPWSPVAGWA